MSDASERIGWMVEELAVKPDDHLLEIGPGHGVAISLVCVLLTSGTITAIDRSAKMAAAAQERNAACVASGKATISVATLPDADFGTRRFNTIFAMNIGVFCERPVQELRRIQELLAPGGRFYLLFQPPTPEKVQPLTDKASQNLEDGGFFIESTISKPIAGIPAVCIVTRPPTEHPPRRDMDSR